MDRLYLAQGMTPALIYILPFRTPTWDSDVGAKVLRAGVPVLTRLRFLMGLSPNALYPA